MITTNQAAEVLQVSRSRILKLIAAGRLPAEKLGRDWLIRIEDLELVKVRLPGRPRRPV